MVLRLLSLSAFAPTPLFELRRGLAVALRAEADKASADRRSFSGGWSGGPVKGNWR
jgi:hypothetical protein